MLMLKHIALIIIGVIVFTIGWGTLLSGIDVKTCSSYVYIPKEFTGRIVPRYTEVYYWRYVVVNLSNVFLRTGTPYSHVFEVNNTLGYIYIEIKGSVEEKEYEGYLSIVDTANNQTIVYTSLNPRISVSEKELNTTLFFLKPLYPGTYRILINLNVNAIISKLLVYGPSSREVEVHAIEISLSPSSEEAYQQIKIEYVCGVSFVNALLASVIVGVGISVIVIGAVIAVAKSSRTQTGIVSAKIKRKK